MFITRDKVFLTLFSLFFLLVLGALVISQTHDSISVSGTTRIEKYDCYDFDNSCGLNVFVPLNTLTEWNQFLNNHPSCISGVTCDGGECSSSAECSSLYPLCGQSMQCVSNYCCNEGTSERDCPSLQCKLGGKT